MVQISHSAYPVRGQNYKGVHVDLINKTLSAIVGDLNVTALWDGGSRKPINSGIAFEEHHAWRMSLGISSRKGKHALFTTAKMRQQSKCPSMKKR